MTPPTDEPVDGRRARRERTRIAVIDAVFALVHDGKVPPTVDQVAERAGVSVSTVFRTFDGLDDLRRQALETFQERFAHLIAGGPDPSLDTGRRVARFVDARVELFEAAGPLLQLGRQRALDHPPIAEGIARSRHQLAEHARRSFAPESRVLSPTEAANLVAMIDTIASPESFDLLRAAHSRSRRQIARIWTRLITALVDTWCPVRGGPA